MADGAVELTLDESDRRSRRGNDRTDDGVPGELRIFDLRGAAIRTPDGEPQDLLRCVQFLQPFQGVVEFLRRHHDVPLGMRMGIAKSEQLFARIVVGNRAEALLIKTKGQRFCRR